MMTELQARQIGFTSGEHIILSDITFTVSQVGITALLGANGVGKTLLMKILAGLVKPTAGSVQLINDEGSFAPWQYASIRQNIGFHGDQLNFWLAESVQQALTFTLAVRQIAQPQSAYEMLIDQCHLGDLQQLALKKLSLGQQRRVGLALALVGRPPLILLDEPTNALDFKEQEITLKLFQQLAQTSHLIITSHRFDEVDNLADRLLILNKGRLCHDAPLDEATVKIYRGYYDNAP
jgi:ABC-type multidrug transport system ATPase subunit